MMILRLLRCLTLSAKGRIPVPDFAADHDRNLRALDALAKEWEANGDALARIEAGILRLAARGYAALWVERKAADEDRRRSP